MKLFGCKSLYPRYDNIFVAANDKREAFLTAAREIPFFFDSFDSDYNQVPLDKAVLVLSWCYPEEFWVDMGDIDKDKPQIVKQK